MMDGRSYRFETKSQWAACLDMALPERLVLSLDSGIEVARVPAGATCFAASSEGDVAWIDSSGAVRRDGDCAGPVASEATRMLFEKGRIWVLSGETLQCIDGRSLQLLGESEWPGAHDIASDGADGVWVLTGSAIEHVDSNGRGGKETKLKTAADSIAGVAKIVALFSKAANQVELVQGNSRLTVPLQKILGDDPPFFTGERISSGGSTFLIEGTWDGSPGILILDSGGNPSGWGTWEDGTAPLYALGGGHDLIVIIADAGQLKLLKLKGAGDAGGRLLLTPPLESDTRTADWLRANVGAVLPEGGTLQLRWASTQEDYIAAYADDIARDESMTIAARVKKVQDRLSWSEARTYVGRSSDKPGTPQDFAFPLHEADGAFLCVELTLHHNQDTDAPQLRGLVVHHDSPSLMDKLPVVYHTPDGDDGGVLRRLVSVLETTTQDLDERIGRLADRLDPERTDKRWLPGLARLLGLPFDEALSEGQQRKILESAIPILAGRGTRRGIIALLSALFEGGSWRVTDRADQLAPITLGGGPSGGSRLPAFLSGASGRIPKLNARLVLGRTGLCPATACDELAVTRSPELLVEIAASTREQRLYGRAVRQMIEAMLPAGVRLRLRWMSPGSGLGETLAVLRGQQALVLGDQAPVERVRLGGNRSPRLRNELRMGHRLQ